MDSNNDNISSLPNIPNNPMGNRNLEALIAEPYISTFQRI